VSGLESSKLVISPVVPKHTFSYFHKVSFELICLKTDISTTTSCAEMAKVTYSLILFKPGTSAGKRFTVSKLLRKW